MQQITSNAPSDTIVDYMVFIGRFQPFHIGHKEVIDAALKLAKKVVILVGSSNQPRTIKNPFTFEERKHMILSNYGETDRLIIEPLRDQRYNDQVWAASVQTTVNDAVLRSFGWTDKPLKGGIIGHLKDETSYYLKLFPQWERIEHFINEVVNATDIRKLYFESNIKYISNVVPMSVYHDLARFSISDEFKNLAAEQAFVNAYKKAWDAAPYAPTFLTCDAVVVQSGHVLLIKRKAAPGKGLLALPGGFVGQTERIEDAMIRELREETKIRVPGPVLRGSIKDKAVFDQPARSLRGRTVTEAFYIELQSGELPVVKGGDDAESATWIPLSSVREEDMFEDHFSIISYFLGKI